MQYIYKVILLLVLSASLHSEVVNEKVTKVFGSSPPMNYLIYALNPDKMVGLTFAAKNANNFADPAILDPRFLALPIIGSFHGGGTGINLENIIKYNPDLILLWEDDVMATRVKSEIAKINIPTLTLAFRQIDDMPNSIRVAGKAIGEEQRGNLLADYSEKRLSEIKTSLKDVKKVRYYYAEGMDGLFTECNDSFHVEAHNYAGGINVHSCVQSGVQGLERISFETVLGYDPDVIVVQNTLVMKAINENPLFKHLRAVKENRVYLVPNNPFNWIDRPPSFMRILGTAWLASKFHPEAYKIDIKENTREFYKLFFNVDLSEKQINSILGNNK
ncbi:MAG: ABC transporter substrate-binding protein [Sulfurimonadaceae bacterium]|jgi:iron complex transport system substrate-binding protein|nr:ABC transporter substrate-binding protein [Sulfurimonadaceae bacterium]